MVLFLLLADFLQLGRDPGRAQWLGFQQLRCRCRECGTGVSGQQTLGWRTQAISWCVPHVQETQLNIRPIFSAFFQQLFCLLAFSSRPFDCAYYGLLVMCAKFHSLANSSNSRLTNFCQQPIWNAVSRKQAPHLGDHCPRGAVRQ